MNKFEPFHWCLGAESNHRHGDFQSPALPTELPRQNKNQLFNFYRLMHNTLSDISFGDLEGTRTLDL